VIVGEQTESFPISRKRISRSRRLSNNPLDLSTMRQDGGFGLFYGWIVVGAAFILLAISAGIAYSTPMMFPFFETDFTIGRGQAAFVFSCGQVMAFVVGPFAGSLAEKLGPRMVVGGGLSVLAAGLLGSALAQSYGELVFSYGMAVGIGSGAIYVPLLGLIQRWFYRRRGLAFRLGDRRGQHWHLDVPYCRRERGGHVWLEILVLWFRRDLPFNWPCRGLRSCRRSEATRPEPGRSPEWIHAVVEREDNIRAQLEGSSSRQAILLALFL
jgi:hypothetical protein